MCVEKSMYLCVYLYTETFINAKMMSDEATQKSCPVQGSE